MTGSCDRYLRDKMPPFEYIVEHTGAGQTFLDEEDIEAEYRAECKRRGLDPWEEYCNVRDEVEEKVYERARIAYEEAVDRVVELFYYNDVIEVYRAMDISNIDTFINSIREIGKSFYAGEMKGVGIFWSWDKEHAFSYYASKECGDLKPYVLVAQVGYDDLDLEFMISNYMMFTFEHEWKEEENEVTLSEGARIFLVQLLDDNDVDLLKKPVYVYA